MSTPANKPLKTLEIRHKTAAWIEYREDNVVYAVPKRSTYIETTHLPFGGKSTYVWSVKLNKLSAPALWKKYGGGETQQLESQHRFTSVITLENVVLKKQKRVSKLVVRATHTRHVRRPTKVVRKAPRAHTQSGIKKPREKSAPVKEARKTPLELRKERDIMQAKIAAIKEKQRRQQRPQEVRDRAKLAILRERRAKMVSKLETQSGIAAFASKFGGYVATAAATVVAAKVASRKVKSVVDDIKVRIMTMYRQALKKTVKAVAAALAVALLWHLSSKIPLVRSIVPWFLGAIGITVLCPHILDFFRESAVETQGIEFGPASLIATIFALFAFKKPAHFAAPEFMKRMASYERTSSGLDAFIDWLKSAIEACINTARKCFGKESIAVFKSNNTLSRQWVRKVNDIVWKIETARVRTSPELGDELVALHQEGQALYKQLVGTSVQRELAQGLNRLSDVLLPMIGSINARDNNRQEPVMVLLQGEPGIGKTLMATFFCATVLMLSDTVGKEAGYDEIMRHLWQKGSSQYWEGYQGQAAFIMDDAFSQVYTPGADGDNDFMNIIRMVNVWSFPLNMATLASKGSAYFNSKLIFATTNMQTLHEAASAVCCEPAAITRRIKHPYKVRVKKLYALPDGKINPAALEEELRIAQSAKGSWFERFPWHIWEFYRHDFVSGQTHTKFVSALDVIKATAEDIKKAARVHNKSESLLRDFVGAGKDERTQTVKPVVPPVQQPRLVDPFATLTQAHAEREAVVESGSAPVAPMACAHTQGNLVPGASIIASLATIYTVYRPEIRERTQAVAWAAIFGKTPERPEISKMPVLHKWFYGVAVFAVVLAVFLAIHSLISGIFSLLGFNNKVKATTESNRNAQPYRRYSAQTQGDEIEKFSQGDHIYNNVYRNQYRLKITLTNKTERVLGSVLFIDNGLCVFPAHFYDDIESAVTSDMITLRSAIAFQSATGLAPATMTVESFLSNKTLVHKHLDLAFMVCKMAGPRKISQNFVKEQDLRTCFNGSRFRLDLIDNEYKHSAMRQVCFIKDACMRKGLMTNGSNGVLKVDRVIEYGPVMTKHGDCGAPLCLINTSVQGRIALGVHSSGDRDSFKGYASVVTQELIEEARIKLDVPTDCFSEDLAERGVTAVTQGVAPESLDGFTVHTVLEKPVTTCSMSKFYKTYLYGSVGEYTCRPAHMRPVRTPEGVVYPMTNALAAYSTPTNLVFGPELSDITYEAFKPLFAETKTWTRDIFTFEEAIIGRADKFRSIPRNTAAGFPYVYDVRNGKKEFFGDEDMYDLTSDRCKELRKRVEYVIDSARRNKRLSHVFIDFLKDELRSAAKVEAVATRMISSAPLDYTVAFRMYFGAFTSAVMTKNIEVGLAPGINTFGAEWKHMGNALSETGFATFAGDFKAFDASEQPDVHNAILDEINRWYDDGEDNARIRRVLWLELTNSRHIGGDGDNQRFIYSWHKSLPSGHPFTTIVNSLYSLIMLVHAFRQSTGSCIGFWNNVRPFTYGDDNIVAVREKLVPTYNFNVVAKHMDDIGMKYTPDNKSGGADDTTPLEELTFLKRRFVPGNGTYLCPLELDSFLYTHYWCKNRKLESTIITDVLENCLHELSLHTEEVWAEHFGALLDTFERHGIVPNLRPTQDAYRRSVLSRTDSWY
ncbi:hypothetical protein 1 [Sanxia picorna-like virus 13]|uniref:hypothetical protein 1 n=1 Tax=Sanxia picorna-like virus 13 TaxID=1923370 RepID=UPI0009098BF8|nr:hypothetical protein 1 [Sanxia picorna-like virus 13]APG77488.1 hypothetical protein 1 [Sanxia picorna-like virus 13]